MISRRFARRPHGFARPMPPVTRPHGTCRGICPTWRPTWAAKRPSFSATDRLTGEKGQRWIRENLHDGDVYLLLGYQSNEDGMAAAAQSLGARTIFLTSTAPSSPQAKTARNLYVNPHWPLTDGCLKLSGYDFKACPLSCILGLTCYYAICGEMELGMDGIRPWPAPWRRSSGHGCKKRSRPV